MKETKVDIPSLIAKYPDVDPSILKDYLNGDERFLANADDPDLTTIVVPLPETPEWSTIENFGLPAKKQKFVRHEVPARLQEIEESVRAFMGMKEDEVIQLQDIWNFLNDQQEDYQEEIDFIMETWYRRLYGYWVFINGKATYIDGWHYFYLNFWNLDVGLPDYRETDWEYFHFARFTYTNTEVPVFKYNENLKKNVPVLDDDGLCVTKDIGERAYFGFINPKRRRVGSTSRVCCITYAIMSISVKKHAGMQNLNLEDAETVYQRHVLEPWKELPFWFRPFWKGSSSPAKALVFQFQGRKKGGSGAAIGKSKELGSSITFSHSGRSAFDGEKLLVYFRDEGGKLTEENLLMSHKVNKECVSLGAGKYIFGLMMYPSTAGEMNKGGRNYQLLIRQSDYLNRDKNGRTASGVLVFFQRSDHGLDGFIDEFGNSVIENPETPVMGLDGRLITQGSKEYLDNAEQIFLENKDDEGYNEQKRLFPRSLRDAFRVTGGGNGLDLITLEERILEISVGENWTEPVRGNFEWKDDVPDSEVIWVPDEEGRWLTSLVLKKEHSNLIQWDPTEEHYVPIMKKFSLGTDPFRFQKKHVEGQSRMSKGAGMIKYLRDMHMDPNNKSQKNWLSNKFVCTYNERPDSPKDYAEDMLKMAVYYGSWHYPENNIPLVFEHFEDRGYGGMLLYDLDSGGQRKAKPGWHVGEETHQKMFSLTKQYIRMCGMYENHVEYLDQCLQINGPEEITNYDLFAAGAAALRGEQILMADINMTGDYTDKGSGSGVDIGGFVERFDY